MNKVFFAKLNSPKIVEEKVFEEHPKWFNGIDVGDFAFIHPEGRQVEELWKAERLEDAKNPAFRRLCFSLVAKFSPPIRTNEQFLALKLFKLDMNLLNQCVSQVRNICFFELQLASPGAIDVISDRIKVLQYVADESHYRKILVLQSENEVNPQSEDVQIYKSGEEFRLFPASFISDDVVSRFKSENFKFGEYTIKSSKSKLFKVISSGKTVISGNIANLKGFYDLFCSNNNPPLDEVGGAVNSQGGKKKDFVIWLKEKGVKSASNYDNGVRAIEAAFGVDANKEFEKDKCASLLNLLRNDENVVAAKANKFSDLRNWETYLRRFVDYKNERAKYIGVGSSTKAAPDFQNNTKIESNQNDLNLNNVSKNTQKGRFSKFFDVNTLDPVNAVVSEQLKKEGLLSANTIFYGVPGCGKSHKVNKLLHLSKNKFDHKIAKNGKEGDVFAKNHENSNQTIENFAQSGSNLDERFCKRILFHPEYSYSDFVGQILPEMDGDKIKYEFHAGPFLEILKDALSDRAGNNFFLVIEEINRGNAPAIFGDLFQLLDRDDDGNSEYPVYNIEILKWLAKHGIIQKNVFIPDNLTIFATMNTSDQNVFTLDTAFKRRWHMSRVPNNFNDSTDDLLKMQVADRNFTWRDFATALNSDIVDQCNDGMVAEDKLLGTHFVKKAELANLQMFAEKIFVYLWNDVVKYNKETLFRSDLKTLDAVIEKFMANENVFNDRCEKMAKLYASAVIIEQEN